ncbi:unnamed protein product [Sphenostylis stenocarpa]|uniref:UDENN domain-containing protein n=1 Tax=Sphenostylis stenocarpa TaxID=92480 RepID=A0AA86S2G2_9FABA|nr:unnamed protein product [Sphenostylis stenocarpa]
MSRIFEYFVVCGIGPEIRTIDGSKGYHGPTCMYLPSLLDQYPPLNHSLYPPPPPQLSTCVLPAGVEFYPSGFDSNDPSSFPRSYPIVLTGEHEERGHGETIGDYSRKLQLGRLLFVGVSLLDVERNVFAQWMYPSFIFILTGQSNLREIVPKSMGTFDTPNIHPPHQGDGSKIYVSCISFRDPICEDIAEAYRIQTNSYADKCICLVSRLPSFSVLRSALEEIFTLCFSPNGSSKPLWDVIAHMVSSVPLPTPGKERVLFAIESCLLSVEAPPNDGLPHADISFLPIVQCLDVDNLVRLFTAVLLERRILLRANNGVDYIDAPTPYMMGLYSGVDISALAMDGIELGVILGKTQVPHLAKDTDAADAVFTIRLFTNESLELLGDEDLKVENNILTWAFKRNLLLDVETHWRLGARHSSLCTMFYFVNLEVVVVDLEYNLITTSEEIPPIPEPEFSILRGEIMKLIYPNVIGIDEMKARIYRLSDQDPKLRTKYWGEDHDLQLSATQVFNTQAFLKKRSRSTNQPPEPMIAQFLDSHGFLDYLERGVGSDESNNNLLDKLQDAIGRGQNPMSILPSSPVETEILTVSDSDIGISGSGAKHTYDRFPANIRTDEQEEKRKQILAAVSNAFEYSGRHTPSKDPLADTLSPLERAAERERMVLDIKVKLQGLWLRLLKLGATDDPLSSFEYGTILALIESDAEGIGGLGLSSH